MNCPNCNTPVAPTWHVCPRCGSALGVQNQQMQYPPVQKKSNSGMIVLASVLGAIVVVGLVLLFAFGGFGSGSGDKPGTEQAANIEDNMYDWLGEREATAADLSGKSAGDLRLMRNSIYARHGYIFDSDDLTEYFKKFSWYEPKHKDVNAYLSGIETKNIEYIQKFEGGGDQAAASTPVAAAAPAPKAAPAPVAASSGGGDYRWLVCGRKLTHSDVAGRSKAELRIMRNTIYAAHNRKFVSPDLQRYFAQFSWYSPIYTEISPSWLSSVEKYNISFIQRYE